MYVENYSTNIYVTFSTDAIKHSTNYISNSIYLPTKITLTILAVHGIDSTIYDIRNFDIRNYGNFHYIFTNNPNLAGKVVTVQCTVNYNE